MTKFTSKRVRLTIPPKKAQSVINVIFKGVLVSLIVSIIFTIMLSLVGLITQITYFESHIQYTMVGITILSIFIGSVYSTKKIGSKGLLVGMAVGLLYVLISLIITFKLVQEPISMLMILNKLAAGIAAGALGGFVGVNL